MQYGISYIITTVLKSLLIQHKCVYFRHITWCGLGRLGHKPWTYALAVVRLRRAADNETARRHYKMFCTE